VTGHAELLGILAADCPTDKHREHLDRVQRGAARMKDLLDDRLAYATADNTTLRIVEIELNNLVDSVLAERLSDGATVVAKVDCAVLPTVAGDPTLVRQVLDNLIGNAIRYTPAGHPAELSISATGAEPPLCRIEAFDHGTGIPANQRNEIFNPFTRAEGSEIPGHRPGPGHRPAHRRTPRRRGSAWTPTRAAAAASGSPCRPRLRRRHPSRSAHVALPTSDARTFSQTAAPPAYEWPRKNSAIDRKLILFAGRRRALVPSLT
jgi:light-regulated signal transduction histidine kinase (bacteriophytochrome)